MKQSAVLLAMFLLAACNNDKTGTTETTGATTPADNTRLNQRDRGGAVTPMDQGNNTADLAITQRIRKALMSEDSLSTDAKNVKIITKDGMVTLRGPVVSVSEGELVEARAKQVAPHGVDNQLDVEAPK